MYVKVRKRVGYENTFGFEHPAMSTKNQEE